TGDETETPQRVEVHVDRVGAPARIVVRGEGGAQPADGRTPAHVLVEVRDARGHLVADGTPVTIDPSEGIVLGVDADPTAPGFQVRTSSGEALARLSPADRGGTRLATASAGKVAGTGTIQFGPHLREWIVAGVGEAGWSASGTPAAGSGGDLPGGDNPFTGAGAATRLAFFAKGRIGDESLLAVSFDSARARDESRLFQGPDPSSLFPIYGDASRQAYELPSQGRLALRWDRRRTSITYGDFQTGLSALELARYDRTLSGAIASVETPSLSVKAFAARTPQREVRDAFPADGSSGPYRLARRPLVSFSERVTLEVRDRYHSERVLATSPQARYTDYDIDYSGGTILFRGPVNSADDGFNPVTIVVTYETLGGGGDDLVAGGRIGWRAGSKFEWGTTAVHEQRGGSPFSLTGMDFTLRPMAGVAVTTEYARAADGTRVAGALALRVSAAVSPRGTIGAYVRDVPTDFSNPSMSGASEVGTSKEGLDYHASMPDGSRLTAETFRQHQEIQGIDHHATGLAWEKPDGPLTWLAGAKEIGGTTAGGSGDGTSGLVDLGLKSRLGKRLDASVLRSQIVSGTTVSGFPTRTDLGAGYKFTDQFRGFVRQEIDQAGAGSASRTLLGAEGAVSDTTTIESRYTLEDALAGERGYATMGVRTRVPITDVWSADMRAERSQTVLGTAATDFTSLSGAAEYLPGKSKFTTQYEVRFGALDRRQLLTTAGAIRLSPDLSLFARQRLNYIEPDAGASRFDADGLVGLAFRPVDSDRYNWLGRLEAGRGEILPGGVTTLAAAPGAQGYLGIFEINVQPVSRWHLLGRYGARYAADTFAGGSLRSYTDLWEGRCLTDVGKRVTTGISARLLRQPSSGTTLTGLGAETGFMLVRDLWLVSGYNFTGFSDARFPDGDRRSQGPFVTLRFKFDESFLAGLKSPADQPAGSTTTAVP
ncbi:MAG TPA: hypothetical protein VE404_04765, partial [Verrucomicrobiae bacterium]|nr:hypothetical protein [Verrucomicrobiae bacterium]